jgi:hypothetical protein
MAKEESPSFEESHQSQETETLAATTSQDRPMAPAPKRRRFVRDVAMVGVGFGAGVIACIAGLSAFSDTIAALDA